MCEDTSREGSYKRFFLLSLFDMMRKKSQSYTLEHLGLGLKFNPTNQRFLSVKDGVRLKKGLHRMQ